MITFIIGLVILFVGAAVYGAICEKVFGPDDRQTPAYSKQDGVDYVPMPKWKNMLINLLNIAGTGPIFGPIQGILFGPIAFITIPIGNIIGGAMHDYFSGMICLRDGGSQMSSMIHKYSNKGIYRIYNVFVCLLLLLVGAVFIYTPGDIAATQVFGFDGAATSVSTWVIYGVIFVYYLIATVFPIDAIIGKIYPIFGAILLFSAVGVFAGLFVKGYPLLNLWDNWQAPAFAAFQTAADGSTAAFSYGEYFANGHFLPVFFVTVACGILSGFHSTQTAIISRTVKSEKEGRKVFYGAMVAEGVIALIWAAAGVAFYNGTGGLLEALGNGQSSVVYEICFKLLGPVGAVIAMIGVIACPISSADTAYRSARLTLADWFKIDQKLIKNRLILTIPLLAVGAVLTQVDVQVVWRYFSWSNQTLAMIALWAASVYLFRRKRIYWLTALPATFMSAVSCTYILMAKEGFQLSTAIAYPAGIIFAAVCLGTFVYTCVIGIIFAAVCLGTFVFTCVMGKGKNADSPAVEEPYAV